MVIWTAALVAGIGAIAALVWAISANRNLRRHAAETDRMNEDVRRASHAQALLLKSIRAELHDPISSIDAHAQLLLGGWRGEMSLDQVDSVQRIRAAAQTLGSLTADLECLAATEGGATRYCLEPVDVRQVVHDIADGHETAARAHRQRIVVRFAAVPLIRTDEAHVRHIVSNIVSRAILHGPPDGLIELYGQPVTTRVSMDQPEGQYISISLLSGEDAKRIDELNRVLSETSGEGGQFSTAGGLRLNVSARLARGLGGDLRVARKNGGLFFFLILPTAPSS